MSPVSLVMKSVLCTGLQILRLHLKMSQMIESESEYFINPGGNYVVTVAAGP